MVDVKEPSMRHFFVLLVTECAAPLGMENGTIQDSDITASSANSGITGPEKARLHMEERMSDGHYIAGWRANTTDDREWIEINLKQVMKITKIATQGGYYYDYYDDYYYYYYDGWVTNFSLSYRVDDKPNYHDYQNNKVRTWTLSTNCK